MNAVKYVRRSEAARYCKDKFGHGSTRTFAKLAVVGGGPQFVYSGHIPLYTYQWIDQWALGKLSEPVRSTSERKAEVAA